MPGVRGIADICSHLQNVSKARLGLTSVPNTKSNLHLALALHRSGFLSSVYRGGPDPPTPAQMLSEQPEQVTNRNVADRRLWLGLKYWDGRPVLSNANVISKPSRRIAVTIRELAVLTRGFPSRLQGGVLNGLNVGECMFVATSAGVLEAREAVERKIGGQLMCRVS